MRSVLEAGFIFWGLFATFGLIVVLYVIWMVWVERRKEPIGTSGADSGEGGSSVGERGEDP
jgi:hypothetical protein